MTTVYFLEKVSPEGSTIIETYKTFDKAKQDYLALAEAMKQDQFRIIKQVTTCSVIAQTNDFRQTSFDFAV